MFHDAHVGGNFEKSVVFFSTTWVLEIELGWLQTWGHLYRLGLSPMLRMLKSLFLTVLGKRILEEFNSLFV